MGSRHALDAKHYISPETFALERENIFGKLWIFAGLATSLKEKNQFFTRKIAGVPLLIQRTEAGLRAFLNECPHRLSPIHLAKQGKGSMVCPYHGWSFGAEGELRGLPNPLLYRFTDAEREKICLPKVHLAEIGNLLFVNFSKKPIAIEQQFSSAYLDRLREVSGYFDSQVVYSCHRVRFNWKLNMENVKDYNHVPFVHPQTFLPFMADPFRSVGRNPEDPSVVEQMVHENLAPDLSSLSYPAKTAINMDKRWFHDLCDIFSEEASYHIWHIYPNVHFCSIRAEHFLIQQYDPVSPSETDYHLWMMTSRRKDTRTDFTALLIGLLRGERKVIAEDTAVLEGLQSNLGDHSSQVCHGDYEEHLVRQHQWYRHNVLKETKG